MSNGTGLKGIRRRYVSIAKDLRYPKSTIEELQSASSESECSRILSRARTRQMAEHH